jgi:Spy/CpxP family protein refolding chaperone
MKRKVLAIFAILFLMVWTTAAFAQSPGQETRPGPGYGMGPGGGYGYGPGYGYGMGPGMMGPGWQGGYGMGPGMMGSYGQGYGYGMGPGMMGNYGYGMGPGIMGGFGPDYGMGSGMFGGYGTRNDLNLSAEQRSKIAKIQNDVRRKHWEIMGKMQDEQALMNELYYSEPRDDAALSKSYRKMTDLRYEMFDLSLSAQKQIDAVLTKEQRDKLKGG